MTDQTTPPQPGPTFGQKACGVSFNPGGHPVVDTIKRQFAATVDELYGHLLAAQNAGNGEVERMLRIAITDTQTAQMWAVKAVTWQH